MTQKGHILRAVTKTNARVIFMKGDIQDPMEAVFNGPMVAGGLQKTCCLVGKTADIVSGFMGNERIVAALALDTHEGVQVAPAFIVADIFKGNRVSDGPTAA